MRSQSVKWLSNILALRRQPPVFVFQAGKVGSSAVRSTIVASSAEPCSGRLGGGIVEQAHAHAHFTPEARLALATCRRWRLPHFVICPVRDPVSRNVSAFFENFERNTGLAWQSENWTTERLLELFEHHGRHNLHFPMRDCIEWFDLHMQPTFDFDALAQPFDIARRWQIYRAGAARILIYRIDLDRAAQLQLIATFIQRPLSAWVRQNEAQDKAYAQSYATFCRDAVLPVEYINRINASRMAQHFWSAEELAQHAAKWSANRTTTRA
jgi:hypothetical protein